MTELEIVVMDWFGKMMFVFSKVLFALVYNTINVLLLKVLFRSVDKFHPFLN